MYAGPSPHARGTRLGRPDIPPLARAIPACAGNTSAHKLVTSASAGHPRMRGEHNLLAVLRNPFHGPSPHARGTRGQLPGNWVNCRAIPACAGNTSPWPRAMVRPPGHPRMRGEHLPDPPAGVNSVGPSPHARGTHSGCSLIPVRPRAIPACAGNTSQSHPANTKPPGHPRMRGEHGLSGYTPMG